MSSTAHENTKTRKHEESVLFVLSSFRGVRACARPSARVTAAIVPLAIALSSCDISVGHLTGRATEEWTHTYPLTRGGVVRIGNTNGTIDVEGVDGSNVEIRAEKIAKAATDTGARELLPRITIKEEIAPDRVTIETEKWSGLMLGAGYEVLYHVRAPKNATIDVTTTNGRISVAGVAGRVVAHTTNGGVTARALTGGVDARSTNGGVSVDMASLGSAPVSLRTTNGGVALMLPDDAKASVSASWTNGGMNLAPGLKVEVTEQSRRKFEGRMNGGGTAIDLHTTNGGIRLRPRQDAAATAEKPADKDERRER